MIINFSKVHLNNIPKRYIHGCKTVHRDLKSANIFLTQSTDGSSKPVIKIGDFGISKVLESTMFATTCVGTPAYMAPEIIRIAYYLKIDFLASSVLKV